MLVNVGRGGTLDEARWSRRCARAGWPVPPSTFAETEPLPVDSPLWGLDNVLVSPHTAALSTQENERIVELFWSTNLRRFRQWRAAASTRSMSSTSTPSGSFARCSPGMPGGRVALHPVMTGTGTDEVRRRDVGFRSERGPVLIGVMLSTGLVAIDSTVIATAVPSVVAELGGFAQFPWLFSVYLLAQAVTVPVYGKLADVFGRKPVMLLGIGLFLLGSILCGLAWSMGALIAFRAVQGLGAGAVQPMAMTIVGDLYSLAGAGEGAGLHRQRLGHLVGGRPDARRGVLRVRQLALDLLRQHPAVPGGRRRRIGRGSPSGSSGAAPRIDYAGAGAAHRRPDPADPRPARGRPGVGVGRRRQSIGVLGAGVVLLVVFVAGRAPGGRAGRAAAGVPQPAAGGHAASSRRASARSCSG